MESAPAFEIEDVGSEAGRLYNDDCCGSVSSAVWMLDGATGLSKERILSTAETDAQWFVKAVDAELQRADWSAPTDVLLRWVIDRVAGRFREEATAPFEQMPIWPFASFALARVIGDYVEFVNLGDCRILWKGRASNEVRAFGSSRVTELDANVISQVKRLHAEGQTDNEAVWKAISPTIQANRELKNKPGGYWILDITGDGLGHLQTMKLRSSELESILLCTDGYYRLVDTYLQSTDDTLLRDSQQLGISQMIRSIREIEKADDRCMSFPRIKAADDATAVLASLQARR